MIISEWIDIISEGEVGFDGELFNNKLGVKKSQYKQ